MSRSARHGWAAGPGGARRTIAGLVVGLVLVGAVACTTQEPEVTRPSGAVPLVQNQPRTIDGFDVVASDITEDGASISVVDVAGDASPGSARLAVGESATIVGLTVEVVDIAVADDRDGEPGSDTSTVWIMPK